MEDEIFGPLLPILTYQDFDAAIREVKKRPKPLASFLFSRYEAASTISSPACLLAVERSIR